MDKKIPDNVKRVLFVCSANCCRSLMGERCFNQMSQDTGMSVTSISAGIAPFSGLHPTSEVLKILENESIDATDHRSQRITEKMLSGVDMVVVMAKMHYDFIAQKFPEHKGKVFLLTDFYNGDFAHMTQEGVPDPIKMNKSFYENVFMIIKEAVVSLIEKLSKKVEVE